MKNNVATKPEKRAKPHKRRRKPLVALTLLVILMATTFIQDASKYDSLAQTDSSAEGGNLVTSEGDEWKNELLNLNLKDDGSVDDILVVVRSQIGYEQSQVDSSSEENGEEPKYYNRYGAVYGHPYDAWNTAFMAFCLQYAKVSEDTFPVDLDCTTWMKLLQDKSLFYGTNNYKPNVGDMVFFNREGENNSFIGIIESLREDTDHNSILHIIVGDYDGKVQEIEYHTTDVIGYGVVPATMEVQDDPTPASAEKTQNSDKTQASDSGEVATFAASSLPATIETVDSRAEGIRLDLFDYNGAGTDLDTSQNSVDNPIYKGINADGNNKRELLFLGKSNSDKPNSQGGINTFTGGKVARQGIVRNVLEGGYPKLNTQSASSLKYLFDPTMSVSGKTTYNDVNHLFKRDDKGYYVFKSDDNYAFYNSQSGGGDFAVYSTTYNVNRNGVTNTKIGFFPFNQYNSNQQNVDPGVQYNHHFGLAMQFDFQLNEGNMVNNENMLFEFTGDDDVWVFIDDVLVLDIGGIHEAVHGSINFNGGEVKVDSATNISGSSSAKSVTTTLKKIFDDLGKSYDDSTWSKHTLKFYYLERGSMYSNCLIKFNLPTGLHIAKKLTGEATGDYSNKEYSFQLYVEDSVGSNTYSLYKGSEAYYNNNKQFKVPFSSSGVFKMKEGETVDIYDINANKRYYLKEIDIDEQIISDVKIDSKVQSKTYTDKAKGIYTVQSEIQKVYVRPSISFDNQLREEYKDITIKKLWKNSDDSDKTGDLPSEIKVELWQKDIEANKSILINTISLKASDSWSKTVSHLPVKIGNKTYSYYAKEITVSGYTTTITEPNADNNYIITICNKENPFSIIATKKWFKVDGSPMSVGMLNKVNITLKRSTISPSTVQPNIIPSNSVTVDQVELNVGNNWTYTWNDTNKLEAYDTSGHLYYYYVEETALADYRTTYDNNGVAFNSQCNTITVNNTNKYVENVTIPTTGGSGTAIYTVIGMVLLSIAMLLLLFAVSNKRRCRLSQRTEAKENYNK